MDFKTISVDELEKRMQYNSSLVLIDVREPKELATFGFIPNAITIESKSFSQQLHTLPSDKETEIVVVCQTGARSINICIRLILEGYTNVYNVQGGMLRWMLDGKKLQRTASIES